MHRSIVVLTLILVVVVISSALMTKKPPSTEATAAPVEYTSKMSLKPYRYNRDFDISSDNESQYSVEDFIKRGHILWQRGNKGKAEDIFKTALLFDSDNAKTIKSIGELVFLDGRYAEANNYFTLYLKLKPNAIESYTNLALSYLCSDDLAMSEVIAKDGLKRFESKTPGPFYFLLACIKEAAGDILEGNEYLAHAYKALGDDIFKVLNAHWAVSVRNLPKYRELFVKAKTENAEEKPTPQQNNLLKPNHNE